METRDQNSVTSDEALQKKLKDLQKDLGRTKSELARFKANSKPQEKVIPSLAYSEDVGLTLERTHIGNQILYEDPQKLLGPEYNPILKPMVPLIALANKVLNNIPVDEHHRVHSKDAEGRPIKDSPELDAEGRPVYTESFLDKLKHDFKVILEDPACVAALVSLNEAVTAQRDKLKSPELKTDKPYINKVKSAPRPSKRRDDGFRGR